MMDIGERIEAINPMLGKSIWKGNHPKIVKFFLWKIVHKAINENFQRNAYMTLFPNWYPLCKKDNKSQNHLYDARSIKISGQWFSISSDHLTFLREVIDLWDIGLIYHLFTNAKVLLCIHECQSPTMEKSHNGFLLESVERKRLKSIHGKDIDLYKTLRQCCLPHYILV